MNGSFDIRMINPGLPDFEDSKVNLAVQNVVGIEKNLNGSGGP